MNRTVGLILVLVVVLAIAGGLFFFLQTTNVPTDGDEPPVVETQPVDDIDAGGGEVTQQVIIPTEIPLTEVVIAVQNIPRGNRIDPSMISVVPFPVESVALGAFDDPELVIGKIARTDIFREQHILSNMVVDDLTGLSTGTGSDIAAVLPQNLVAISVPVDRITSVAYALQPGDRVDVIVSMLFVDVDRDFQSLLPNYTHFIFRDFFFRDEPGGPGYTVDNTPITVVSPPGRGNIDSIAFQSNSIQLQLDMSDTVTVDFPPGGIEYFFSTPYENQRPRLATQITVRNALVMWIGNFPLDGRIFRPAPTPTDAGLLNLPPTATPTEDFGPPTPTGDAEAVTPTEDLPDLVTLAVTPQDAIVLTYFIEARLPITFALRSASTVALQETEPVTLRFILERYNIRVPDKLTFAVEPAIRSIRQLSAGNRIELQAQATPTTPPEDGEESEATTPEDPASGS